MTKITKFQKLELYDERKVGKSIAQLSHEYGIGESQIHYLIRLIDKHGKSILERNGNNYYSPGLKTEIINKVLVDNQPVESTAIEYGLPSDGLLGNWIKKYKEDGYVIVEKPRGRSPTMPKKDEVTKPYDEMTSEEKIKYLEEKNLYLEAENEFLKKLETVVQKRKKREQKK